jgi:hypothetical protein
VREALEREAERMDQLFTNPSSAIPALLAEYVPPSRPSSPVRASRGLMGWASRDPNTQVRRHLEQSQVPGLSGRPFSGERSGGGFLLTQRKYGVSKADLKRAERGGSPATPKWMDTGKNLEFHPGGGIHSNYEPSSEETGGSYIRVGDTRVGRHGAFRPTETIRREPIRGHGPPKPPSSSMRSAHTPAPTPIFTPVAAAVLAPSPTVMTLSEAIAAFGASPSLDATYTHKIDGKHYKCVGADSPGNFAFSRLD